MHKFKRIKTYAEDHAKIKVLAAKLGKSMQDFIADLLAAYKGKK